MPVEDPMLSSGRSFMEKAYGLVVIFDKLKRQVDRMHQNISEMVKVNKGKVEKMIGDMQIKIQMLPTLGIDQ